MKHVYSVDESYRQKRMASLLSGVKTVVDVGFSDMPNSYLKNEVIIGVDPNAIEQPENYSDVFRGDLKQFFLATNQCVDAIYAGELIEHLEDPIQFLRECIGGLAVGGRLVLSTPNPNSPIERLLTIMLTRRYFYTSDHLMLYPQRWLIRMLEYVGFRDVELYSGGFPIPRLGCVPFPRPWCHQTIAVARK